MGAIASGSKYSRANHPDSGLSFSDLESLFAKHMFELADRANHCGETVAPAAVQAMEIISGSLRSGGKILACGNGGSASDAQHLVAEFVGRMSFERRSLPAVCLTSDGAVLTALGNDYGYEEVFARQVRGLGKPGDVLVVLSTSGRSPNVVQAAIVARQMGLRVISLTGPSADPALELADAWLRVESFETTHIQEIHSAMVHTICLGAERLAESGDGAG